MAKREKWRVLTNPKKEFDASCINIQCVDGPKGEDEGYIVTVTPKNKQNEPGKSIKTPPYVYTNPIQKLFKTEEEVLEYLGEIL